MHKNYEDGKRFEQITTFSMMRNYHIMNVVAICMRISAFDKCSFDDVLWSYCEAIYV